MNLKQKIELIEKDENSNLYDKIELVLVLAGEKPATKVLIADTHMDSYNERRMREVESMFAQLELSYEILDIPDDLQYFASVYVGKDKEWCSKMLQASTDREYGNCFGFQETAIDAFIDKSKKFKGSKKERVEKMNLGIPFEKLDIFMDLNFSDKHFEDEVLSTSFRWHNTIKELSPEIYSQINPKIRYAQVPHNPTFDDINSKIDIWYVPLITIYFAKLLVRAFH